MSERDERGTSEEPERSTAGSELSELRDRHMARAHELEEEFVGRLSWDADRMREHRRGALRSLVAQAVANSPWHRKRLAGVDLDALDPDDLTWLPTMTKAEVMADFDEIVVDERLRLADVEEHLETSAEGDYILDEYIGMATGGSTGRRSVSVFDWDGAAVWWLSFFRRLSLDRRNDPELSLGPVKVSWVGASHPSHASSVMARTFNDPGFVNTRFPVTLPIEQIVAGLNEAQPNVLFAYPSALALLAREATAGRLRIEPIRIMAAAEPLLPEIRAAAEAAWGRPVVNFWGATEIGVLSLACREGRMHVAEDIGILEVVDADGAPVPPGTTGAKIYVTNLFNRALPLIRYEISDEVTVLPDPCPCGEPTPCIADVQGRMDDLFHYPTGIVHPHLFRSSFSRRAGVVEYQVRQTPAGATVDLRCTDEVDLDAIRSELAAGLATLGLTDPQVDIHRVEQIARLTHTGKLKRFLPLAVAS